MGANRLPGELLNPIFVLQLERSISEAKTVFSFTDRALSLKEDAVNPTETALAQLYAHIQGLPDSSHKKRLIKQFNKENGNGTPRTKSLGVTIKVTLTFW